jgi:hypothetical protein
VLPAFGALMSARWNRKSADTTGVLAWERVMEMLPKVTEYPVGRRGLTGHGGTHDPRVSRDSGLTDYIRDVWLPGLSPRP